jgi:ubiquinone/menaquinone biosynthesis C-methylase UbiE
MSLSARVLEPEVMDSREEAVDYDAMDHGEVNRQFVDDFAAAWLPCALVADARILDLGTGTAQIPIEFCRTVGAGQVLGADLAEYMLEVGRANVARAGLSDRIELRRIDAKRLPFADGEFSAVMSNSIVHHIPSPGSVVAEAWRVLRPGGLLFVRDLLRPDDEPTLRFLVDTYAGGANLHQQKMFEDSLRAALTLDEIRTLVEDLGLKTAQVQATSDRHWTLAAVKG